MEGDKKIDEEMLGLDNENEEEIDFVNSGSDEIFNIFQTKTSFF